MSRVAKKPIILPQSVSFELVDDFYLVSGPNGKIRLPKFSKLNIEKNGSVLSLVNSLENTSKAGLLRSLLNNAIIGVTDGFTKILELKGLGFRCSLDNQFLVMSLGFSHKISYAIPSDVKIHIDKDTIITIKGSDKQRVGQVASDIRSYKIPDNYHAKGILYQGEVIITKEGKKK